MQKKYLNQTLFIIAKMAIILFGFFFWFIIFSYWSTVAGIIVGALNAAILLIVMNAKRSIDKCDNVSTRHADPYADARRKNARFTQSNERLYKEQGRRLNP